MFNYIEATERSPLKSVMMTLEASRLFLFCQQKELVASEGYLSQPTAMIAD
jgi:hypothetical protein